MTTQTSRPSRLLRQWQNTLCDSFDMLTSGNPLYRAARAVAWENAGEPDAEQLRAWLVLDWAARTMAPAWLVAAGLTDQANALRALPAITSPSTAAEALDPLNTAVCAAVDVAEAERQQLDAQAAESRDFSITVELAANAGDQAVRRQSCGALVEYTAAEIAAKENVRALAAAALRAARASASAVVWRALREGRNGGTVNTELGWVTGPLLASAVELLEAMGDVY